MADDDNKGADASTSTSPSASSFTTSQPADDRTNMLAQATRFLTSANISESASDDDKRDFLRSKGLSEDEIARAFQDAKSPVAGLHARSTTHPNSEGLDPFEIAARQFDDPINADALVPPPKSYPNSPLALYYDPPAPHTASSPHAAQQPGQGSPLTRYQVLLQFFRTLSYMMMLGGGVTAIVVSAYRAYILPKITAMFDARSIVLKHHIVLFDKLRSHVAGLATYVPVQQARIGSADDGAGTAVTSSPLKGVLKKVHFHDEVGTTPKEGEKEGVKLTQHGSDKSEKVVMPGTDVVVDAKTPLLSEADQDSPESEADGDSAETAAPKLEPIDLTLPIRESMTRLAELLRSDLSDRSTTPTSTSRSSSTSSSRNARATTVNDAGSGSDSWEDEATDDDDGLEFDPYGAYQKKHKHTQSSAPSTTKSASLSALKSTLVSLNADISTHSFASGASYGGGAFRFGPGTAGAESPKSGDLGQVKAEIRSLKGLLLSRRNFPSYGARPPPLPGAGGEGRVGSAVV